MLAEINTRYATAAVFFVQRCGFTPDNAMEQAEKFDMNGSQLYNLPIDDIKCILPLQAQGVWRFLFPRSAIRGKKSLRCISASTMEESKGDTPSGINCCTMIT